MIRITILALITIGLCYFLNTSQKIGGSSAPPLGSFMSPFHGFWKNAEDVTAPDDFVLDNLGLIGSVEVVYDERMVPHIFGDNLKDVLFVQGYIHAKHRLWQMDIATRSAAGRLSEVMGEGLLKNDLDQRRMGMPYAAENAIKGWSKFKEEYDLLTRYTDGVNAYINTLTPKTYPLEFKLLGYAPEEWTAHHSSLFMKNMAMTLCSGYADVENTNLLKYLGTEKFNYLYPEWNPKQSPIIPADKEWDFDAVSAASVDMNTNGDIGFIKGERASTFQKGIGSNNWAVSGSKTKSGNPILCGDPHLQLTLPSIWYEVQLHVGDINTYGVSLPGIPGVIIGFNEDIAWTETNVGHDVWDFYKMDWVDDAKTIYRINGKEKKVRYRIEEIKVKGSKTIYDTLKMTDLGIITKHEGEEYADLAFDWIAHHVPDRSELSAFLDINKAKNYEDFSKALENYLSPAQNFAFASRHGNIAIHVNGKLPIKDDQAGRFVADGSLGSNWKGYIPRNHLPQDYNPDRGFISSANQHSTSPDYPYYYNTAYFENYRGRILNDKLEAMSDIIPEDMMALHYDATSYKAKETVPILLDLVNKSNLSDLEKEVIDALSNWNYEYTADSKASSYFDRWWYNVYINTFDEIGTLSNNMDIRYPASSVLVRMLEEDNTAEFFDIDSTLQVEDAKAIVQQSFDQAIVEITDRVEKPGLEWYKYRKKSINHLGRIGAFSRKNIKAKGHGDALNAFGSTAGPSWRMVVSMDEKVNAKVVYPGGQDGNPGSKYYDNMVDTWVAGKYYDAHFALSKNELSDYKLYQITFK
ncbi:MAG: penicillin acylase family protein [Saprospiraceae bacterium]